jgi:hypothetical protein
LCAFFVEVSIFTDGVELLGDVTAASEIGSAEVAGTGGVGLGRGKKDSTGKV